MKPHGQPWKRYNIPAWIWKRMGYTHAKVQALRRESRRPVTLTCVTITPSPFNSK